MTRTPTKQDWVAALRSGDHRQTTRSLRKDLPTGPAYCCLGVACALFDPVWAVAPEPGDTTCRVYAPAVSPAAHVYYGSAVPIEVLQALLGLAADEAFRIGNRLIILNDTYRLTFPEIADRVERMDFSSPETPAPGDALPAWAVYDDPEADQAK
jgi:hypothetical protein